MILRSLFVPYLAKVICTDTKEEFEITDDYFEEIPDTINEFNSDENVKEKSYNEKSVSDFDNFVGQSEESNNQLRSDSVTNEEQLGQNYSIVAGRTKNSKLYQFKNHLYRMNRRGKSSTFLICTEKNTKVKCQTRAIIDHKKNTMTISKEHSHESKGIYNRLAQIIHTDLCVEVRICSLYIFSSSN